LPPPWSGAPARAQEARATAEPAAPIALPVVAHVVDAVTVPGYRSLAAAAAVQAAQVADLCAAPDAERLRRRARLPRPLSSRGRP
jgi:predicted lipoprotein